MSKLAREHLEAIAFDPNRASEANVQAMALELIVARARIADLAAERNPGDEVLVEGSWFHPDDLPKILGNHMRSLAEEGRRSKEMYIELEKARARIAELEAAQRPPLGYEDFAATINQQADRIARLEAFVSDLAESGTRHDLNPTGLGGSPEQRRAQLERYIRDMDASVRARARRVLREVSDRDPRA